MTRTPVQVATRFFVSDLFPDAKAQVEKGKAVLQALGTDASSTLKAMRQERQSRAEEPAGTPRSGGT